VALNLFGGIAFSGARSSRQKPRWETKAYYPYVVKLSGMDYQEHQVANGSSHGTNYGSVSSLPVGKRHEDVRTAELISLVSLQHSASVRRTQALPRVVSTYKLSETLVQIT